MKRVPAAFGVIASLMLWAAVPVVAQVERPRDTNNTRAAEDALEDGDDASNEAERQGYFQTALTRAQAEITENPNNPLGYRIGAFAALALGQYEVAGGYFDRAGALYPLYEVEDQGVREQTWIDLYQQAGPLLDAGDYAGAAVFYENAHAIYQGRPEIMVTLAQIYASIGEYDRSVEFVDIVHAFMASEQAEASGPEALASWQEMTAELPLLKAQVLGASDRLEEARAAYESLRESDPSNVSYTLELARIHMNLGNNAQALEIFEELLSTPGVSGPDQYAIGVGFYNADDFKNAVRGFSGAATENPRDRDAIEMWARSLQLDSLDAEVPAVARRWLELDPNSQSGWAILAQTSNAIGDAATTQEAMVALQALEVAIDQLELQRFGGGGGIVGGFLVNKTLAAGASVALELTFYGSDGREIGTATERISVGEVDTPQLFEVRFDSAETVGGYSYTLTVG